MYLKVMENNSLIQIVLRILVSRRKIKTEKNINFYFKNMFANTP